MTIGEPTAILEEHLGRKKAGAVAKLALPSVWMRPAATHTLAEEAGSRLGGDPLFSAELEWPRTEGNRPLSFLGQFRLEEIKAFDTEGVLPTRGLLSVFYDVEAQPWGGEAHPSVQLGWRLLLVDSDVAEPRPAPEGATQFRAVGLTPRPLLTLPGWEEPILEPILGDRYARDNRSYNVAHEAIDGGQAGARHRLLGWPDLIQAPMAADCRRYAAYAELDGVERSDDDRWRMVLQIDTDDGIMPGFIWGDVGRLYFWMREADLRDRAFERAWMISQCS